MGDNPDRSQDQYESECAKSEPAEDKNKYQDWIRRTATRISEKCRAGNNKEDARDRVKLAVEIAALLVAMFYASVTYKLFLATGESVAIAKRQLDISQRPWISFNASLGSDFRIRRKPDGGFAHTILKITLENIGHSPAFNIIVKMRLFADLAPRDPDGIPRDTPLVLPTTEDTSIDDLRLRPYLMGHGNDAS